MSIFEEDIWNEAVFEGVTGAELEALNETMDRGELTPFEPQPNNVYVMTEQEIIDHAHETRDNFLQHERSK